MLGKRGVTLNTLSVEDLISSLKCHEIGLNECHTPFFDHLFFTCRLNPLYRVIFSNVYIFYFAVFYRFFSQHSTYLYLSILSVRFANIFTRLFSNFHPLKFYFYLFVLQTFHYYFLFLLVF